MNIERLINRYKDLCYYNPAIGINEMFDKDCQGWICIGYIPNGNKAYTIGKELEDKNAYIMVDPNAEKIDDRGYFKYRNVAYKSNPKGEGMDLTILPYDMKNVIIYPEYKDTYYEELFFGRKKTKDDEIKHQQFMHKLNRVGNDVILKHDSSVKITDGYIKQGEKNSYSNNSDIGIYFWGTKKIGNDKSNNQYYTYICTVPFNTIYDFENNMERFNDITNALNRYRYVAQYWQDETDVIVVNTFQKTQIQAIRNNRTGKYYDSEWNEINM